MIVPDDFGKGYPVGYLISNRSSKEGLTPFLEAIKENCTENFEINALMTDDSNSGCNAFKKGFPSVNTKHLLCRWHIVRAWGRKSQKVIQNKYLQNKILHCLMLVLNEKSQANFDTLVDGFIEKFDKRFPEFVSYFKKNYLSRCHQWAMCYQNFSFRNTDTNMYVEGFYNRLTWAGNLLRE